MLNHRNTTIITLLLLVALFLIDRFYSPLNWLVYLLPILLFSILEFYGAAYIQSNFHIESISVHPQEKLEVALTFDDGPSTNQTGKVLDVLEEYNAKATFFCIGKNIESDPALTLKIIQDGHILGNHSYSHDFWYDMNRKKTFIEDIQKTNELIKNISGLQPTYFRPPYGVTTPSLAKAIKKINMQVIGWNIRSFDTKLKDSDAIVKRIEDQLKPGSIILLHDSLHNSEITLRKLLEVLKLKNYKVVPLHEMINTKAYV